MCALLPSADIRRTGRLGSERKLYVHVHPRETVSINAQIKNISNLRLNGFHSQSVWGFLSNRRPDGLWTLQVYLTGLPDRGWPPLQIQQSHAPPGGR